MHVRYAVSQLERSVTSSDIDQHVSAACKQKLQATPKPFIAYVRSMPHRDHAQGQTWETTSHYSNTV